MIKLLNRPLKAFAIYSTIILFISVPVYVLVVDRIWVAELDENNWLTLEHTRQKLQSKEFSKDDIEKINQIWGELQPGLSITQIEKSSMGQDSVYEAHRPNEFDKEDLEDRFRGLKSYLEINGQAYQITIETNVEESDETFLAVSIVTFFFFLILILGFILLNRKIAASSWRQFYETLRTLKSFDLAKDSSLQLSPTNIIEFQELNESLQQLVESNIKSYQLQKSFTENASHELQTPIALLKSKLDHLLQQKEVTPELAEIIAGIEAPLSRLSRINKNLLLLAKVENQQYRNQEELDVKKYIDGALTLFEDYLQSKNLIVSNRISDAFTVTANPFLLETLIQNFLSNAIRHTSPGGEIQMEINNHSLYFLNSGEKALNENHLFERFSALSTDKISSGLGLSIIKEIANKNRWELKYNFNNGFHVFSVGF